MIHSYYLMLGSTKKQAQLFQLPTYRQPICRDTWWFLHDVSARTFRGWVEKIAQFDPAHSIQNFVCRVGEESNKFDVYSTACIRTFLEKITSSEWHPMPIRALNIAFRIDSSYEFFVYLPPRFTNRRLYRIFLRRNSGLIPSWAHFLKVIDSVVHIHIFKRESGLCDIFYISRERFRTVQDQG